MKKHFGFRTVFVFILFTILLSSFFMAGCAKPKTENVPIILIGENQGVRLEIGSFEVTAFSSEDKLQIVEVLKDDADKFEDFIKSSEFYLGEIELKDCYNFQKDFSKNFHIGDKCAVLSDGENYWICRKVLDKYFYFMFVPYIKIVGKDKDGTSISISLPEYIFASDIEIDELNTPYKVLYDWEELKDCIALKSFDDSLKTMYINCFCVNFDMLIMGNGTISFEYNDVDKTITFSDECEVSDDAYKNSQS